MITGDEETTAARAKSIDPEAVTVAQTIAGVDGEEPQLVEVGRIQAREHGIVRGSGPIARHDVVHR